MQIHFKDKSKSFFISGYVRGLDEAWHYTLEKWKLRGMGYVLINPSTLEPAPIWHEVETCGLYNFCFQFDDMAVECSSCPLSAVTGEGGCRKTPAEKYFKELCEFLLGLQGSEIPELLDARKGLGNVVIQNYAWRMYHFLLKVKARQYKK